MGVITPLNEALQGMNIPFMHPERFAELAGCSVSQIKNGFTDGSIPFCTPFAKEGAKRPTRYVFLKRWLEQLEEKQAEAEAGSQNAGTNQPPPAWGTGSLRVIQRIRCFLGDKDMTQEELSTAIFIAQIESFIWGGMLGAIVSDAFRAGVNTLVRGFRAWRQHRDLLEAIERDKARIKKEGAQ